MPKHGFLPATPGRRRWVPAWFASTAQRRWRQATGVAATAPGWTDGDFTKSLPERGLARAATVRAGEEADMAVVQTTTSKRSRKVRVAWQLAALAALVLIVALLPSIADANFMHRHNAYVQANLISDIPGVARITDPNLVNPWGMAAGPTTPLWIADNGMDVSTLYTGGIHGSIPVIVPLVVDIPGGAPTGIVFNPTADFVVQGASGSAPANFIFSSEAGQITAWSKAVSGTQAVSESTSPTAVYKGLAMASTKDGTFLYATNFHDGTIDVFDKDFAPAMLSGSFTDPTLPAGFAPFGIQSLNGKLYVTYAMQDAFKHDDVKGPGNGFVDVFSTSGHLVRRLISQGDLNSPWGLVLAPHEFGAFSHSLLIGNFGDGAIHAYDPWTGKLRGQLMNRDGNPIMINGLWSLRFGNGVIGTPRTLLFTAGIGDESHGLFGEITAPEGHH